MSRRRRRAWIGLTAVGAVAVMAGIPLALAGSACVRSAGSRSVVLILTDDQRHDTLWAMPNVQRLLAGPGVTFTNAVVDDPLCCPARSTVLTGQYVHHTGVWQNTPPLGGFPAFRDASTVATWLQGAGFRTALFGKYLNRYEGAYVPPGWDHWAAFAGQASRFDLYYRYALNVDGRFEVHGRTPEDYSTDVLADRAVEFVCRTPGSLFLYFAPFAPHSPYTPGPGDAWAVPELGPWRPPAFDEADVSDKPAWVRALPRMSERRVAQIEGIRRASYGSLVAVDRAVARIVEALEETGRLRQTLIVYTSDHGFSWGEHRWVDKIAPYEESIRVPLVVRDDTLVRGPGRTDPRLVSNIDLAPTFAAAAGTAAPGADGTSFLPLLSSQSGPWRTDVLVEGMRLFGVPGFCGVRSDRHAYVWYETGEEELYDLAADPAQLENRAGDPALRAELERYRERVRTGCRPLPPFVPPPPG